MICPFMRRATTIPIYGAGYQDGYITSTELAKVECLQSECMAWSEPHRIEGPVITNVMTPGYCKLIK